MRRFIFLATSIYILLLCTVSHLASQETEEWYIDKPIEDIVFDGLDSIGENELSPIIKPFKGKTFTNDLFWNLQGKLYALDYFEQIVPNAESPDNTFQTVVIRFTVKERPLVDDIKFTGNQKVRTGDILDTVLIKRGDMINKSKIKLDEEAVYNLYIERGFPNVTVFGRSEVDEETNTSIVYFEIDEGSQTTIQEVVFVDILFASESTLRGLMKSKAQSIFNKGIFQENLLEQDIRLIENYYWERGYIDARVVDVTRESEKDDENNRNYLTITIYIAEGERFSYGGMSFQGNTLFSTEKIESLVKQKPGSLLNKSKLEADFGRVADLYYENGYIFNTITRDEVRNSTENSISYVVTIVERGRAHIENIIIKGNEKTKDHVLYREIPLEVGDIFSKKKIVEGLQNLYNLRYFTAVTPETPQGSAEGLMDLVINVEETSTADIGFGVAFGGSTEFPVSGQLRWTDINFLGRGQTMGIETLLAPDSQSVSYQFSENWLFGRRWSAGISLAFDHSRATGIYQDILAPIFNGDEDNAIPDPYDGHYVFAGDVELADATTLGGLEYPAGYTFGAGDPFPGVPSATDITNYELLTDYDYDLEQGFDFPSQYLMSYDSYEFSLALSTGYRFSTPIGMLSLSTSASSSITQISYDQNTFRAFDPTVRENLDKWLFVNKWNFGIGLDKRDYFFSPSKGFYLRQGFVFTGGFLFGSRHYIRSDTRAEAYFTLVDVPVFENWNYKLVLGMYSRWSFIMPQVWVPDEYRGEDGSRDVIATPTDLLFIDGMYIARGWPRELEGRALWNNWIELRMPIAEQILWFDIFLDAVGMWDHPSTIFENGIEDFKFSIGPGLRFVIPNFPLRFYFAKRFHFEDGSLKWINVPNSLFPNTIGFEFVLSIGENPY
jgi:outer membrane protein insertion porin family